MRTTPSRAYLELLTVAQGALGYLLALPKQYRPDEAWFAPLRAAVVRATDDEAETAEALQ